MTNADCEIWYCEYYSKPFHLFAFLPTAITNSAAVATAFLPLPLVSPSASFSPCCCCCCCWFYCWQWVEMVEAVGLMCSDGC